MRAEHGEGKEAAAAAAATVARRVDGDGEAAGRREAARRSAMAPRARALEIWREAREDCCAPTWLVHGEFERAFASPSRYLSAAAGRRQGEAVRVCGAARLESNLARPMAG